MKKHRLRRCASSRKRPGTKRPSRTSSSARPPSHPIPVSPTPFFLGFLAKKGRTYADPGRAYVGMTTAKMKLVVVKVELEDKMEYPVPKPDPGEHIVIRVVELAQLNRVLQGACAFGSSIWIRMTVFCSPQDYDKKVCERLDVPNVSLTCD